MPFSSPDKLSIITTSKFISFSFSLSPEEKKDLFILPCQESLPAGRCGTSHPHPAASVALINVHIIPFTK